MLWLLLAAELAGPVLLKLRAGESVAVCKTGAVQCPAASPICDDTSVVGVEDSKDGIVFRGLKAGTTLCSVATGSGFGHRQVFRVEVRGGGK